MQRDLKCIEEAEVEAKAVAAAAAEKEAQPGDNWLRQDTLYKCQFLLEEIPESLCTYMVRLISGL